MTPDQPTRASLLLARVFWMMLGPLILVNLMFAIVVNGSGWFTLADFAFVVVLGGLIFARWFEGWSGSPQTSMGERATPADFRRYALATLILGVGAWTLANLLGNHWLSP